MPTSVYYIPSGPKNLAAMFPAINWNDVDEYYIEVEGATAQSPIFKMDGCEDDVNITFVNYLGGIDSIGLSVTIEHETKGNTYQRPLKTPLVKSQPGTTRLSIHSNDNHTGTVILPEDQLNWFDELLDSPLAWKQVEGTQGQGDDYIPIVISDQTSVKKKDAERFNYEATVKFSLSHERIIISN